jgi:GGDEF domain-containing protein/uncharacterized integral membrane protein
MQFLISLGLAIAFLAVVFALQNPVVVAVRFFTLNFQSYLPIVLLSTLGIGVLAGLLVSIPSVIRRNWSLSRQKRQIEDLTWQLQEKDRETQERLSGKEQESQGYQQDRESLRQSHRELMYALGTTDPQTGFLKAEFANQTISYLVQQMAERSMDPHYRSLCVYAIEAIAPDDPTARIDASLQRELTQAIAHRLATHLPSTTWWHFDGQRRFVGLVSGVDASKASDYGETLRASFANEPASLRDGTAMPLSVSIGGAIAQAIDRVDTATLMQKAEEALEHAKKRGRNRFRLVEAKSI